MGKTRGIVLIAAIAILAVGCSDDKPAATPKAPGSAVAEHKEPCSLLPGNAVAKAISLNEVTGAPGPDENAAANGGRAKTCVYSGNGKQVGALAVTRYEGNKDKPAEMIAAIKSEKAGAVDVSGIGEGAVYYVDAGKTATLVAADVGQRVPTLVSYTGPAHMTGEMMAPLVKQVVAAN